MRIETGDITLRPWKSDDEDALVRHANNPKIARNLADVFPSPYTQAAAREWIASCAKQEPKCNFAIEHGGEAIGGIGVMPKDDVHCKTLGLGYWLGEACWGRGIATRAVRAILPYGFDTWNPIRIEAWVFGWNPASGRVLEKAGFTFEARLKDAVYKNGEVTDKLLYRLLRREWKLSSSI